MTRRISMRRCVNCTHYNGTMCVLEDLAPCRFKATPEAENQRVRNILLVVVTLIAVAAITALWYLDGKPQLTPAADPVPPRQSTTAILREYHAAHTPDTLTEWQMLTLAIMLTESRFNPDAVGTAQDSGILQLRPVYIREVNRVAGTDYAPEDAFDPDKAVEIFNTMQQFKNPGRDLELAVYYHNKSPLYLNKVLENLELIRRYEAARKTIKR